MVTGRLESEAVSLALGSGSQRAELSVRSLRAQAADAIRAGIVSGSLVPGRVYSAVSLARELGVSATPVREAMHAFVNAGLMETVRNRGFRIPSLSAKDLDDVAEIRLFIEVPATVKVAGMQPAPAVQHLRDLADAVTSKSTEGDVTGMLEADQGFHLGLVALGGNPLLTDTLERMRDRTRLYSLPRLAPPVPLEVSVGEHHLILDAVERGDLVECERLTRQHILRTRQAWAAIDDLGAG